MSYYAPPSLVKMEAPARHHRTRPTFSLERILGDPFALASISIAIMAWLIAFVSAVIATINPPAPNTLFPRYAWWGIAFYLVCIVGVTVVVALDSVYNYHVAVVACLAYALFLGTSAIDNTIYVSNGAFQASAAGFILLSADTFIWIFYFGSQPASRHRGMIDSFALHGSNGQPGSTGSRHPSNFNQYSHNNHSFTNQPNSAAGRLHGLETSSPEIRYPDAPSSNPRASPVPQGQVRGFGASPSSPHQNLNNPYRNSATHTNNTNPASTSADESVSAPTEYPHRARAIYSYEANPDDANEISFAKHEILDVSDVSGRWWQARKATGETGIAPSNYLIML